MWSIFNPFGCGPKPVQEWPRTDSSIVIKSVPEDIPQFRREYTVKLTDSVSMKITAKSHKNYGNGNRVLYGELDQKDGKWVLFDPEAPADKILDRELLPLVQIKCQEILVFDKRFRDGRPNRYIDENGDYWTRNENP